MCEINKYLWVKGPLIYAIFFSFNLSQCIKVDNELLADTKLMEWEVCNNIDQYHSPLGTPLLSSIYLLNINNFMYCVLLKWWCVCVFHSEPGTTFIPHYITLKNTKQLKW